MVFFSFRIAMLHSVTTVSRLPALILLFVGLFQAAFAQAVPSDYLVLKWTPLTGLQAEYHQVVDLPAKQFLLNQKPEQMALRLDGAEGQLAWMDLSQAQLRRGEFHGHEHIDGFTEQAEEVVFVVRAPVGWVKQLTLPMGLDRSHWSHDWQQLIRSAVSKGPQSLHRQAPSGSVDNRVNLLFLGDGYVAAEESAYHQDVDDVLAEMTLIEPYQSYAEFLSYDRLFVASNQSGADKPAPCFNPVNFVDTAFDAKFCTNDIQRLLTVNASKVYTAAAASPNWDEIVVIVNDSTYGGAGGAFSTISTNSLAADVFIHEYGHTFTRLADEYTSPYPGFPACSDINGPACEANVTDETVRANIKWNHLIDGSTPVPTPVDAGFDSLIGLFEGARYQTTGMYRPRRFCTMSTLGSTFCAVCQEAYVFRVYAVPYADGGALLSLIEPGTALPASSAVQGMVGVPLQFSVNTLQPSHDLQVTWLVDDAILSAGSSGVMQQSLQYTPQSAGEVTIKVRVVDQSPLVHSSRQAELPVFEHSWTLTVVPFVDLIFADGFNPQ
jgi:hypothetical protein